MKQHAIIPIFIPHQGCPNDCIFCNQKKITAKTQPLNSEDIRRLIETYRSTLADRGLHTLEIAFFGGSFTGIPMVQQNQYLSIAKEYKDAGLVDKIHLSTRPDYIDKEILDNLKKHGVDIIELGVQSFDSDVLRNSNRGHSREVVYTSAALIQDYGFELGLQLMIGLPGDSREKAIASAREAVKIGPSIARIYPTVIIHDTALYDMYLRGEYKPLSQEEAVKITKEVYLILKEAGINVIRIGLKSTDLIQAQGEISGGTYHPAFRQLVEAEIAKEQLENQLLPLLNHPIKTITFVSNGNSFSNMVGNRKSNRIYFEAKYPHIKFYFKTDANLADSVYLLQSSGGLAATDC